MSLTARSVVAACAGLAMTVALAAPAFAQADPQVGTWKLNVAKSKYDPGPAPTTGTTAIEAAGKGTKVTVDQTMADGAKRHYTFISNYDGKDAAITGENPDADTVAR